MKCIPMNCAGRPVDDASLVIEMDEVLLAKIASRLTGPVQCLEHGGLCLQILENRLDDQITVLQPAEPDRCRDILQGVVTARRRQITLLNEPVQAPADGLKAPVQHVLPDVGHPDPISMLGEHLGDPAAHGPRSDHSDRFDLPILH